MQFLSNWDRQWLVTFNPLKTEAVLFTLKKINILPQLVFDKIPINFVDSHKHLGVSFSSTGQWHSHIENIVLSVTKIWGIMRKLKYSISRNAFSQMDMSFLLSVVEYASVVCDGCSEQDSQTHQWVNNISKPCEISKISKAYDMRKISKINEMRKISLTSEISKLKNTNGIRTFSK